MKIVRKIGIGTLIGVIIAIIAYLASTTYPHPISIFSFGVLCYALGHLIGNEIGIKEGIKLQKDYNRRDF